ncbi:hypothetical protein [Kineococcus sp. R86509]|uniref:hypothetical protein n=1 Tax=Kineococcus sp. R86509 TaxID=3093851 RepID=UPI0036D37389
MRDPRAGGGDSFYAQPSGRAAFNPGNAAPFEVPRTEGVPRRVGRNPVRMLISWAVFLVVVIVAWRYGFPAVMNQVHAKSISAVTDDLGAVSAAEENYQHLYGTFTPDLANLAVPGTLSRVTVVSASLGSYCLEGRAPTGSVVRYFSPAGGMSEVPCR